MSYSESDTTQSQQPSFSESAPFLRKRASRVESLEFVRKINTGLDCPLDERRFENLEEILASYGRWHPFYRRKVFISSAVVFFLVLSTHSLQLLSDVAQTPVDYEDGYCACVWNNSDRQQKKIVEDHPKLVDLDNFHLFGNLLGLMLLFLANRIGRRCIIGVSMMLNGCFLAGIFYFSKHSEPQTRLASILVIATSSVAELSVVMNTLEWVPSAARPAAVFVIYSAISLAKALCTVLIRYSFELSVYLLLIFSGLTVASGILVIVFLRDSPYFHLSKHNIDKLHFSIMRIAQIKKNKVAIEDLDKAVDDSIDDVAFDVFEGNDSVMDAMIRALTSWRLLKVLSIMIIVSTSLSILDSNSPASSLGFFRWGVFESELRRSIVHVGGLFLALIILSFERRRTLLISLVFIVIGVLLSVMFCLPLQREYDPCTRTFVAKNALGFFNLVLSVIYELVRYAGELFVLMFSYYPTAVRPVCVAFQFGSVYCLAFLLKILSHILTDRFPISIRILPVVLCIVVSGLTMLLPNRRSPLSAWYADLDPKKKQKKREAYPKPLLSTKPKNVEAERSESE